MGGGIDGGGPEVVKGEAGGHQVALWKPHLSYVRRQ